MKQAKRLAPLAFLVAALFWAFPAHAQNGQITGTVTDSLSSDPLPGVNVVIAGTQQGASTDAEGNYTITGIEPGTYTLQASFIGYAVDAVEGVEVVADETTVLDFVMQRRTFGLNEVVVVGYGTQRRAEITGAVASVSAEEFVEGVAKDAASLIKGKIAGLRVTAPSGDPTEGTEIRLRGTTTLNASSNPLVLIDGIPGSLETVAPQNIESISVLKDGSAAAIYGSRASNGVILITTKTHEGTQPSISYQGYISSQQVKDMPNFLDAEGIREAIEKYDAAFKDYGYNTDWVEPIFRTPISHNHNLNVSGGVENTNYFAALNYAYGEGIFIRSNNEEMTGRINVDHSMFENRLNINVNLISRIETFPTSWTDEAWRQSLIRNPTDRIKNDEGDWVERPGFNYYNPIPLVKEAEGETENREFRLNGTLTFQPTEHLNLKVLGSTTRWNQERGYATSFDHRNTTVNNLGGTASRGLSSEIDNLLELTGTYQNSIGAHSFDLLGGYSHQRVVFEGFSAYNENFPTDLFDYNIIESGQALSEGEADMDSYKNAYKLIGFFSRLSYDYDNRYILMGSIRYEGNSKFGADHKWGWFPAVSAGWRISEENFMSNADFISNLKIRAGFGVTGIAPDDPYQSLASYSYGGFFYNNGEWVQGIQPSRNPNPDLRWERKEEINLGLDFAVLDSRLSGSFDVYRRTTEGLLFNYDVPSPPYLYSSILANVGVMRNEGIEVSFDYAAVQTPDFGWETGLVYSTNRNTLVSLSNDLYETDNNYLDVGGIGESVQLPTHRIFVGGEVGNFFGYKSVGIDEDGGWLVESEEGEAIPYLETTLDDRQVLGNGIPDHVMAWTNTFRYKNFDLNVLIRGAFGFQILNETRLFYENPRYAHTFNLLESAFDEVYGETLLNNEWQYFSYYVEDGDYIKIDNVTLGYTVDIGSLGLGGISNARIWASGQNLFTFTGYSGMDPEVDISGLTPGVDNRDKYPTTRTFTLGLNLNF